ncbi:magnetosome biogenesis CDF transporter MamB [Magnetospira sp. QH-2]|uniref:Magnetosome protein MamB n=1 Tax=Magnetospira sp. (strain QH-2) TaxID=1288970 RepID=MAMB_MAGSQ|nr:magnetosome biogenesis CDF transporter MamB [Magnetospira sp. QH-2]W6KHH6.1 RecName: Full=Magnetosome protein MamB; AltName: Full=Probable iron transporter MamB [Magnetospira sp. QH-2]CCQ73001.1 Magnetosome protein MamB [Magnetospira sp. QH-2]
MTTAACRKCRDEVIWWAFFINIGQTTYKGVLGVLSGSAALVADAMHSGADVVATLVTMFSVKVSDKKADEKYPFGYGNIQFIASSIVGLILFFGALYLMYESTMQIIAGNTSSPSPFAVLGAIVSIATNELMFRYQSCVGRQNNSPAIIANAWDNRSDALSSVAVLIGIVAAVVGFPIADRLAAIGVGILVAKIGIELNIDAINGLMDTSVENDVLVDAYNIAKDSQHVHGVHYIRGRNVGEDVHLDINIYVDADLKVFESDLVADAIRRKIEAEVDHVRDVHVGVTPVRIAA